MKIIYSEDTYDLPVCTNDLHNSSFPFGVALGVPEWPKPGPRGPTLTTPSPRGREAGGAWVAPAAVERVGLPIFPSRLPAVEALRE